MKLSKFIKIMSLVTVVALIYIHMQIQIFGLAYQGKSREKNIIQLSENNRMIAYNILRLKSSNHLGLNLLTEDSELKFRDNDSVVQLVTAEPFSEKGEGVPSIKTKKTNPLLSFLSLRAEAEARAAEKRDIFKP